MLHSEALHESNKIPFVAATVRLQLHSAEMAITEIALNGDPTKIDQSSFQRTKFLYACMHAVKQWIDTLLSIPEVQMNGAPTSLLIQTRHAMGLLYALSTIDEPGWRKEDLASTIELFSTLDRLGDFFSRITFTADAEGTDEHWWGHVASTVRTLRSIWSGQDDAGQNVTVPVPHSSNSTEGSGAVDGMDFDFPGLDWLIDPAMMASSF